jgi:rSAM/selenodomain-associated transferase 1
MGSLRPGLIVMAKQPMAGLAKTRLCPPLTQEQAAGLADAFLVDIVANAQRADCAEVVLAIAPDTADAWFAQRFPGLARIVQLGADLGERLSGVFEAAWSRRYCPCVVIGADSPDLPPERLRAAFTALRSGPEGADLVLGPAEDGGYYLIGLKGKPPDLFREIAWSSEQVLAQTLARAEALDLRVHLLPNWYDIDTVADLERLRAGLATTRPDQCPATRAQLDKVTMLPSGADKVTR